MANMGYVVGTGLGKSGEGRVEPVIAVALPRGKSLGMILFTRKYYDGGSRQVNA